MQSTPAAVTLFRPDKCLQVQGFTSRTILKPTSNLLPGTAALVAGIAFFTSAAIHPP